MKSRNKRTISTRMIPVDKMVVDCPTVLIRAGLIDEGGIRITHSEAEGRGYQRDPFEREARLDRHGGGQGFRGDLSSTPEVSERPNGDFAIIDGGGRWLMAQKSSVSHLECRVHTGLSREEEAALFVEFATQRTALGAVDKHVARSKSGDQLCIDIDETLGKHGYAIARTGAGAVNSVSALYTIYAAQNGKKVLDKTAKVMSESWLQKGWRCKGNEFMGVAILVYEAMKIGLKEDKLIRVLEQISPNELADMGKGDAGVKSTTNEKAKFMAAALGAKYNNKNPNKVSRLAILGSDLADGYEARKATLGN